MFSPKHVEHAFAKVFRQKSVEQRIQRAVRIGEKSGKCQENCRPETGPFVGAFRACALGACCVKRTKMIEKYKGIIPLHVVVASVVDATVVVVDEIVVMRGLSASKVKFLCSYSMVLLK